MKKNEAISILATSARPREPKDRTRYDEAVKIAINALTAQPEKRTEKRTETHSCDCISRQAAIDALDEIESEVADGYGYQYEKWRKYFCGLPSAQPEIIRCTECKHYREYDSEYVENAVVVQCMADRYPISETIPDGWFCAGAERKDDE